MKHILSTSICLLILAASGLNVSAEQFKVPREGVSETPGPIIGWGVKVVNSNLTDIAAIAAGGEHNVALKKDGSIVGRGNNQSGQTESLAGYKFSAVSAGHKHTIAIIQTCPNPVPDDMNGDCKVDWEDILILFSQWWP